MSGYVERKYVFKGEVPGKFFDDVYSSDWGDRHLKVFGAGLNSFGDATEVVLTADSEETIDWYMQDWRGWEVK